MNWNLRKRIMIPALTLVGTIAIAIAITMVSFTMSKSKPYEPGSVRFDALQGVARNNQRPTSCVRVLQAAACSLLRANNNMGGGGACRGSGARNSQRDEDRDQKPTETRNG
jgi:hypothetical protein